MSGICGLIHRPRPRRSQGKTDGGPTERGPGLIEDNSAHRFLKPRVRINGGDLPQGMAKLLLEILGGAVFLTELFAQIVPTQLGSLRTAYAAQPMGEPGVHV